MKFYISFIILVLLFGGFDVNSIAAQKKSKTKTSVSSKVDWSGTWKVASRFSPNTLEIKMFKGNRFEFVLEGINGASAGSLNGQAAFDGKKAIYDDRTSIDEDSHKQGCVLNFTHSVDHIDVEQTSECTYYAGSDVLFAGKYHKDAKNAVETDFVYLKVFPDSKLDSEFKTLVGDKEYERFLDSFHVISEEEDVDKLNAKVFNACVRGVCPHNAAIIMFDKNGKLWAAIVYPDWGQEVTINYYSNAEDWKTKMPKTIAKWVEEKKSLNENVTIYFKNGEGDR